MVMSKATKVKSRSIFTKVSTNEVVASSQQTKSCFVLCSLFHLESLTQLILISLKGFNEHAPAQKKHRLPATRTTWCPARHENITCVVSFLCSRHLDRRLWLTKTVFGNSLTIKAKYWVRATSKLCHTTAPNPGFEPCS